jgi:putative DNA primase/helicase
VDDPLLFYVLPGVFKSEVAKGFDSGQFARTLGGRNTEEVAE